MDRTEHSPSSYDGAGFRSWTPETGPAHQNRACSDVLTRDCPQLRLVSNNLVLAAPSDAPGEDWTNAMAQLAKALGIDLEWSALERAPSLMDKARQVIGSGGTAGPPVFAPWLCWSPAAFQKGVAARRMPRAQWVASYLFDSGAGRSAARPSIDLVLMSPLPWACEAEDASTPPMPRMSVLKTMLGAASSEGRKRLAIILSEANRNAMAAQLVAVDNTLTRSDIELELLSIEQAVVRMQSDEADWEAVIVMPELRGIVFAMLAEWSGVSGPWPMLWHDRRTTWVSGEALDGHAQLKLDATLLIQALALAARQCGCGYVAERLHQSWAALRDRGLVTPSRGSSAPYVNQVAETEFVGLAAGAPPSSGRALPEWKGLASGRSGEPPQPSSARLSIVASR